MRGKIDYLGELFKNYLGGLRALLKMISGGRGNFLNMISGGLRALFKNYLGGLRELNVYLGVSVFAAGSLAPAKGGGFVPLPRAGLH